MKNLGLIGGFLLLIGSGPGRFLLDAMRSGPTCLTGGQSVWARRDPEAPKKVVSNFIRAASWHRC